MNIQKSIDLFAKAKGLLPGGVSSPVRAFRAVGGNPLFMERGVGPYLYDVDHNRYIDYVLSWGPLILGHAHPKVVAALEKNIRKGTSFGAPSSLEVELAELIQQAMPNIEMMRFVNSGTEATMSALRLARAYTGRNKIIKFEGCYHGHADLLLVQAGSGVATLGLPDSPGVPPSTTRDTLVARYNDLDSVTTLFDEFSAKIAAVIVEPVAGNMGVVLPKKEFLNGLRHLTDKHHALLVFDEVMTGFRVHPGGAQSLYDIEPDLTTLGKVIGGGLPVGAYGGRKEIMELVAPSGDVYQAGTLSGNPLAMSAGIATLKVLQKKGIWGKIDIAADCIVNGIEKAAKQLQVEVKATRVGTMFSVFFTAQDITDWNSVASCDTNCYSEYFLKMLENGVYLPPSQFEANFVSLAHSEEVVEKTVEAATRSFSRITGKKLPKLTTL
ncbi:MAG: glutamate-1-semialdehyde 2,1-aminomutase [Anaerolineales bacterium]